MSSAPDPEVLAAALHHVARLWAELEGAGCPLEGLTLHGRGRQGQHIDHPVNLAEQAVSLAEALLRVRGREPATGGNPAPGPDPPRHSPDFRSVYQDGRPYYFTEPQARVVEALWNAREQRVDDLNDRHLIGVANSDATKLAAVFRDNDAWGRLIVEGHTRGTHRLARPGEGSARGSGEGVSEVRPEG